VREAMDGVLAQEIGGAVTGRVEIARGLFQKHSPSVRRFLDVGCGAGVIGRYLGESVDASEICGVDVSQHFVDLATEQGLIAERLNIDDSRLPFDDGSVSAIFCGEVIEHLRDPDRFLDELARVLEPEGICILTTPNLASWLNRLALLLGWTPFNVETTSRSTYGRPEWSFYQRRSRAVRPEQNIPGHIYVMTVPALNRVVTQHGFSVVDSVPYGLSGNIPPGERHAGSGLRRFVLGGVLLLDRGLTQRGTLAFGTVLAVRKHPVTGLGSADD
jgi:SAM-dependent methyltransferase